MGINIRKSARDDRPSFHDDGFDSKMVTMSKLALTEFCKSVELTRVFTARFRDTVDPIPDIKAVTTLLHIIVVCDLL